MIIVHDIFICKPGFASKVAKLFKELMADNKETVHILTDMTGPFNKVVMVSKFENLADYEQSWDRMQKDTAKMKIMEEKMKGFHDMYVSGAREIYKVW